MESAMSLTWVGGREARVVEELGDALAAKLGVTDEEAEEEEPAEKSRHVEIPLTEMEVALTSLARTLPPTPPPTTDMALGDALARMGNMELIRWGGACCCGC
jgi:hypothetical protein